MNSFLFLMAALVAFTVTAVLGWWLIPFLHKLKFGQTIREVGPSWHKNKQGTPTMGGILFILGVAAAVCSCVPVYYQQNGPETYLMQMKIFAGLAMALAYGAIGFMDDYISIKKKRNLGLNEKQKLILQFLWRGPICSPFIWPGRIQPPPSPSWGRWTWGCSTTPWRLFCWWA